MHFNFEIDKDSDNIDDTKDNDQKDDKNNKKSNNNNNNNGANNNNKNSSIGKSKFFGQFQHTFGNMNNKNKQKRSRQSTIIESMGARLREMVSVANTNDIHHHIKRPLIDQVKKYRCFLVTIMVFQSINFTIQSLRILILKLLEILQIFTDLV